MCRSSFGAQTLHSTQTYPHILEYCPIYIVGLCVVCCSLPCFLYAIQPPALIPNELYPPRPIWRARRRSSFFASLQARRKFSSTAPSYPVRAVQPVLGFPRRREINHRCGGIGDFLHARDRALFHYRESRGAPGISDEGASGTIGFSGPMFLFHLPFANLPFCGIKKNNFCWLGACDLLSICNYMKTSPIVLLGRRLATLYYCKFADYCEKPMLPAFVNRPADSHFVVVSISVTS